MFEVKKSQKKTFIINENKDNKTYNGKKRFKIKKPKKESKKENNNLNNNKASCSYYFIEISNFDNHKKQIYPWDNIGFVNSNYQSLNDDKALHLEEGLQVEVNHSPSSELFLYERYPTINYGDYDDTLNIRGFENENEDTNYKTEEKQ